MSNKDLPSHDFYQSLTHLTLSVYMKGYGVEGIKDNVKVEFDTRKITINLPALPSSPGAEGRTINFEPLYDGIDTEGSTYRVLNTKIEIKLLKINPINWPSLLSDANSNSLPAGPSSSSSSQTTTTAPAPAPVEATPTATATMESKKKEKKNWDKVLEDELVEDQSDDKDPNSGGDTALQKFFSQIYGNADPDTRRAMIKSFTESGGTTLSTDWSNIGKERTPVRPPEGMEEKKL
ncbi:hypothetical protein V865_007801 [Kwoniella europaea PYCC6329]|uniref:SGS-domain-containing protein n=1 Tax=Kwoniella europaea PYCC6329 TaxID=1423913 RepID=A0AAX4KTL1_9TREE